LRTSAVREAGEVAAEDAESVRGSRGWIATEPDMSAGEAVKFCKPPTMPFGMPVSSIASGRHGPWVAARLGTPGVQDGSRPASSDGPYFTNLESADGGTAVPTVMSAIGTMARGVPQS
jgi:hypothetical protein